MERPKVEYEWVNDDRKVASCVDVQELEKYIDYLEDKINNVDLANVSVRCDGYTISSHPNLPDGRKVIWLEGPGGDGTTIVVKKLFEQAM